MKTLTKEDQANISPKKALDILLEGNIRFQTNLKLNRNLLEQVNSTSDGQHPFAVVLSCIDSRTSAELIFDQGLGDIFSVRIAGNVLNEDILGSMEFACKLAGAKLIVVMGHSACGAVKGACAGAELGHLTGLLQKIQVAVDLVGETKDKSSEDFVQEVAEKNVEVMTQQIMEKSSVIKSLVDSGEVAIAGVMYSVQTGEVKLCSSKA